MVLSEHSVAIPKSISWSSFYLLKFQRHPHYIFSFFSGSLKSKEVLRLCESNGWVGFWWLVSTIISTTLYILMGWWYRYLIIDTYLLLRITHRLNSIHLTHDSNFSGSSTTSIWDSKDWLHHSNHVLLPENSQKSDSNGQFTRNFNFMHLFKGLGVFVFPPWACRFTKKNLSDGDGTRFGCVFWRRPSPRSKGITSSWTAVWFRTAGRSCVAPATQTSRTGKLDEVIVSF